MCHFDTSTGGFTLRHKQPEAGDIPPNANGTCGPTTPPATIEVAGARVAQPAAVPATPSPTTAVPAAAAPAPAAAPAQPIEVAGARSAPAPAPAGPCWATDEMGQIIFDTNGAPVPCGATIQSAPVTVPLALPATGDPNALDYCGANADIEWVQELGAYICSDPGTPSTPTETPDSTDSWPGAEAIMRLD